MKTQLLKMKLGALLVAGCALAAAQTAKPGVIALYSHFLNEPPAAVKSALQEELGSIMGPMGMRFEWRDLAANNAGPTSELAVVTFKGHCDVARLSIAGSVDGGALGWTHVSDGEILPFSEVDCDQIRLFLQRSLVATQASGRQDVFGKALARVLAHELYHIFGDTVRHGSCGIAKEAYTVQDLLSSNFRFQDKDSKMLKSSRAMEALERAIDER